MGGSYYVEALTNQIEKEALKIYDEVEKRGGYHNCHDYVRAKIEASAVRWRDQVDAKTRILVGVNKYVSDEIQDVEVFKVNPEFRARRRGARQGAAREPRSREVGGGDGRR